MTEEEELEALSSLRAHPGWHVFVTQLEEARKMNIDDALYRLQTIEQLWHAKGWLECADSMLRAPEEARAQLGNDHE